jgi:hypothetical protein
MPKRPIRDPKEFESLNRAIALYSGRYANWRSSGLKGPAPLDLLELIIEINAQSEIFLTYFRENMYE